jgi:hypothetical protein
MLQRYFRIVFPGFAFVLVFGISNLAAQYAKPPETYSLTQVGGQGMTAKIHREGAKVAVDRVYPPGSFMPTAMHIRGIYDLQTHKSWQWNPDDAKSACTAASFSGPQDWGDPFAASAQMLAEVDQHAPKQVGTAALAGFKTKVLEAGDGQGNKSKFWVDEKYGLVVKMASIDKDGRENTTQEIKQFSLSKPPASAFAPSGPCAKAK